MSSAQRDLEARDNSEVSIEGVAGNNYVVLEGMERNRNGYRQVVGRDVRRMFGSNFSFVRARGLSGIRRAALVPIVRNYRSSRSPRFWPSFPKGNWVESGGTIEDQREQTSESFWRADFGKSRLRKVSCKFWRPLVELVAVSAFARQDPVHRGLTSKLLQGANLVRV